MGLKAARFPARAPSCPKPPSLQGRVGTCKGRRGLLPAAQACCMVRGHSQSAALGEPGGPLTTVREDESRGTNKAWSKCVPLLRRAPCKLPSSCRGSRSYTPSTLSDLAVLGSCCCQVG